MRGCHGGGVTTRDDAQLAERPWPNAVQAVPHASRTSESTAPPYRLSAWPRARLPCRQIWTAAGPAENGLISGLSSTGESLCTPTVDGRSGSRTPSQPGAAWSRSWALLLFCTAGIYASYLTQVLQLATSLACGNQCFEHKQTCSSQQLPVQGVVQEALATQASLALNRRASYSSRP